MSKAKLRKELDQLDAAQLRELISDIYDSSKEAKAFLEFFLNPDADALRQKKIEVIAKELRRVKRRGISKARISVVRAHIKEFASFGVGYEQTSGLMLTAISLTAATEKQVYFTSAQENGLRRLIAEYLKYCAQNGDLAGAVGRLSGISASDGDCTRPMQKHLREWIDEALGEMKPSFN